MLAEEYRLRVSEDRDKDKLLLKPFFDYLKQNFVEPIRVLDFGCGNGLNLNMFVENNFISVGVDISEAMTAIAREVSPKSIILTQDFLNCSFETETFEGVLSKASIHLFKKEDAIFALDKIFSLLVPNGMLFIATTASDNSNEGLYHKRDYKTKSMRFRKFWRPEELEEVILQVGFKIHEKFRNYETDRNKNWFNILAIK